MSDAAPLTWPELARILDGIGGFEVRPLVAVAVSGGPDSMALTLLVERWARQRAGQVWGLTVDHGLRCESAEEARTVAAWLAARGIPHEILPWTGPKPASGVQEAAREARYRLLAGWCRAHGCLHLMTAHHRDDQVETYLIRRRAGSGVDGLAGMSAVRELPGCRLVRPLLAVPRERLAALLAAEGQQFLRDPSNLNPVFERARLRLGTPAAGGPPAANPPSELAAELREYGRCRIAREQRLQTAAARIVALHPAGFGIVAAAALAGSDAGTAERLLSAIAGCIGVSTYPARRARLARLRAALVEEPGRARTLGGCRFVPWRGYILVLRELAASSPPAEIEPGGRISWDRRFSVSLPASAAGGFTVCYLGQRPAGLPKDGIGADLPPVLHAVLPAFCDDRGLAAVPHLNYRRAGVPVAPRLLFRPARPLIRPSFTVV